MNTESRINLVVAHGLEAKPLCRVFGLERVSAQFAYPLFQNRGGMTLIVSGMGKSAAAAAVHALGSWLPNSPICGWLNIGIAGHQSAAIGSGLLAHKITDAASGSNYYPPQLFSGFATTSVITVDEPESLYPVAAAYEMEAAGFYPAATQFVTSELVQVFKIISDNPEHPVASFQTSAVAGLVAGQSDPLQELVARIEALLDTCRQIHDAHPAQSELLQRYHFTSTQRVQLQRFCERYRALAGDAQLHAFANQDFASGKALLGALETCLKRWGVP